MKIHYCKRIKYLIRKNTVEMVKENAIERTQLRRKNMVRKTKLSRKNTLQKGNTVETKIVC
jgi:hypothetical protein